MKFTKRLPLPPAFALPRSVTVSQQARLRSAVGEILEGRGSKDHVEMLVAEIAAVTELRKLAIAQPKTHLIPVEQLEGLCEPLAEAGKTILALRQRLSDVGHAACNYEQRQSLLGFADIADQMHDVLPRRLWMLALRAVARTLK